MGNFLIELMHFNIRCTWILRFGSRLSARSYKLIQQATCAANIAVAIHIYNAHTLSCLSSLSFALPMKRDGNCPLHFMTLQNITASSPERVYIDDGCTHATCSSSVARCVKDSAGWKISQKGGRVIIMPVEVYEFAPPQPILGALLGRLSARCRNFGQTIEPV